MHVGGKQSQLVGTRLAGRSYICTYLYIYGRVTSPVARVTCGGGLHCNMLEIKRDPRFNMSLKQYVTSMGLFGKYGSPTVRNVVLFRKHGADPPSAIPVKVAAAYKTAGETAGAPILPDFNAEVRIRRPSLCLGTVGRCETSISPDRLTT